MSISQFQNILSNTTIRYGDCLHSKRSIPTFAKVFQAILTDAVARLEVFGIDSTFSSF